MHDHVSCPKCGNEFAVGAALHGQVRVQLQGEMYLELQRRAANAVLEREQTLATERASVRAEAERVVEERMALRSAERLEEQRRQSAARLGDVMQDLEEARKRVESAALKERELLRRERELTEARSTIDLETERRMVAERSKIQADAEAQAAARISLVQEQARLRDKEQEEKTAQLQRSVDALQQRLTQGPQQAQGEAQELVLKDILVEAFGADCIEDVEKGVRGADLVHRVYSAGGAECGTILWESKRTQGWSEGWLEKLRDDQRAIGAACAIIVTQALPPGVKSFAVVDGVWVCGWSYASALATALRMGMHDLHQARRTTQGRDTKMHLLYDYLIGHEFRNRITGVIESMVSLQEQLQHEQRAFTRIWKKRGMMLTRALTQISSVYGDLEGIVGSELAELAPLALPSGTRALGAGEQDEPDDGDDGGEDTGDTGVTSSPELESALLALLPGDGSAVGNVTLRRSLAIQMDFSEPEFLAVRALLIARGRVKGGKGRGGSLARVLPTNPVIPPAAAVA